MFHNVGIVKKERLTHNVIRFRLERPEGFEHSIGQAVEVELDIDGSIKKTAPFTLTNLPDSKYLELIIKIYPEKMGFTYGISKKKEGDVLCISDPWDSYQYHGKGTFIAAGSGITPFIPMLEQLKREDGTSGHKLIYANKCEKDIILKNELENLLGQHFYNILSGQNDTGYTQGRIDRKYLSARIVDMEQYFYVCGPESFSDKIKDYLITLGVHQDKIQIGY